MAWYASELYATLKDINTSLIALQHVETYVQKKIIITSHDVSLWRDIWAGAC